MKDIKKNQSNRSTITVLELLSHDLLVYPLTCIKEYISLHERNVRNRNLEHKGYPWYYGGKETSRKGKNKYALQYQDAAEKLGITHKRVPILGLPKARKNGPHLRFRFHKAHDIK